MKKDDLNYFKKWFLDYVNQFSASDNFVRENIDRKIVHTAKVCENILLLAKSENVDEEGCRLAETIALFHDLGRFEQFFKYRTFKDSESENHAFLGSRILRGAGVLSHISREEKNIILKAIEYHNLLEIHGCTDDLKEFLIYLKLVRDADKLDILRIACENYIEAGKIRNPAIDLYLPDTPGCSEFIVKDILNNKMPKLVDVKNLNDMKLLRLGNVFDVNFLTTITIIIEQRYIDKISSTVREIEEIGIIKMHINNFFEANCR